MLRLPLREARLDLVGEELLLASELMERDAATASLESGAALLELEESFLREELALPDAIEELEVGHEWVHASPFRAPPFYRESDDRQARGVRNRRGRPMERQAPFEA